MYPLLYFSLLSLFISAACWAEILPSRSKSQDLAHPQQHIPAARFPPPLTTDNVDAALLDIVLIASVDGKFRALSRTTGKTLWEMAAQPANPADSQHTSSLGPLVHTVHAELDPDLADTDAEQETYIIEPQSGDIYVAANRTAKLERFPFSMSELVDLSPFTIGNKSERRFINGQKKTSLLLVELETGKVKSLNAECLWDPFEDLQGSDLDLDELEDSKHRAAPPTEVFIGRTGSSLVHACHLESNIHSRLPHNHISPPGRWGYPPTAGPIIL